MHGFKRQRAALHDGEVKGMTAATPASAIFGLSGTRISPNEAAFFKEVNPLGYILFTRNCDTPAQVSALTQDLRDLHGRDLPILIDQEGGRVARLKPPHWPLFPPAAMLASLQEDRALEAIFLNARLIAHELSQLGINVDCAPVADIRFQGAHDIVGDRAYGDDANTVASLARAMAEGLMAGGVLPVLKHIPGHGRALADSHEALPVVETSLDELRRTDFVPFKELNDLPFAMTAHVLYTAIDAQAMATVSPKAIRLIREEIGFHGLLMSDDLSMRAMEGAFAERAAAALRAGCDIALHCNGDMKEMEAIAVALSPLPADVLQKAERAIAALSPPSGEKETLKARLDTLLTAA